jgi:hypothetical protein
MWTVRSRPDPLPYSVWPDLNLREGLSLAVGDGSTVFPFIITWPWSCSLSFPGEVNKLGFLSCEAGPGSLGLRFDARDVFRLNLN